MCHWLKFNILGDNHLWTEAAAPKQFVIDIFTIVPTPGEYRRLKTIIDPKKDISGALSCNVINWLVLIEFERSMKKEFV